MKRIGTTIIILIILFLGINKGSIQSKTRENEGVKPLTTQITNISYAIVESKYLHENHTHFEFIIKFDLSNPNNEEVQMAFGFGGEVFYLQMNIQFKDENIEVYNDTYFGGQCCMHYPYIKPGITKLWTDYVLSIKEKNRTQLPDGRYSLCVAECNFLASVTYNHSLMIVNNGEPFIKYSFNTITLNQNIITIFFGVCFFVAIKYFTIKSKKRKI